MRFIFKLVLAGVLIAALMPLIGPNTSVGTLVRAALDDAAGFCARRPDACADGALIARDAGGLIASTITALQGTDGRTLTDADRAIAPDQTIPPSPYGAPGEAFSSHGRATRD